jgi:hypothetical protein
MQTMTEYGLTATEQAAEAARYINDVRRAAVQARRAPGGWFGRALRQARDSFAERAERVIAAAEANGRTAAAFGDAVTVDGAGLRAQLKAAKRGN